jgi:predicted outer membrane repeat protein
MSSKRKRKFAQRAGIASGGTAALVLLPAAAAQASVLNHYVVRNKSDNVNTANSLPYEIAAANTDATSYSSSDLITFASNVTGSIKLTKPLPTIDTYLTIKGPGARKLTLDASGISSESHKPAIYTDNAHVMISGLTLANAHTGTQFGGFLDSYNGAVYMSDDTFSHNSATSLGGALSVVGSVVDIDGCTFSHNSAPTGGAFADFGNGSSVIDSTFADNSATVLGGGLYILHAQDFGIFDSTIADNSVSYSGKGTALEGYGGGIAALDSTVDLYDSIFAENRASGNSNNFTPYGGSDHQDIFFSHDSSLESFDLIQHDAHTLEGLSPTDILGASPDLGPLRFNGGQTETLLPSAKSPVINAGKAFRVKSDQRGYKRTVDYPGVKKKHGSDGTDIGAVELQIPKKKHKLKRH